MRKLVQRWRALRWRLSAERFNQIAEDMYYEQAERDGCDYPPQWRG